MSHTMIHLKIAMNIINSTDKIKNKGDFILGAMAPDAVHFRESYVNTMKHSSHMCVGDEAWGSITNNDEWKENILKFMSNCKDEENRDFLLGYCTHILTDVQNSKNVWLPYKNSIIESGEFDGGRKYVKESHDLDYVLYLEEDTPEIIRLLSEGSAYSISDIILKDEIEQMKKDVLKYRYNNREKPDITNHRYVTLEDMERFISVESEYIKNLLFDVL